MSQERMKILELLAAGTISAADAERLLSRLDETAAEGGEPGARRKGRSRYIRVEVDDPDDGQKTSVRIPTGFLRSGLALGEMLPKRLRERLKASEFNGLLFGIGTPDEMMRALDKLEVDVDEGGGRRVRIFSE